MYPEDNKMDITYAQPQGLAMARTFIANVFSWMFIALIVTSITSYLFAASPELLSLLVTKTGMTMLGWIVMLGPLGFVLLMGMGFQRLSFPMLTLCFIVFAILMGMSMSFILLAYTMSSVFLTFAIAASMFGIMAVTGYTTKVDLTRFGALMFMGLIGIVIASIVNMFMRSDSMQYVISFIGVLVFTGLTAYDVQKLKRIGSGAEFGAENTRKLTIMGALTLYLDFINLFLFLLRFFGNRR